MRNSIRQLSLSAHYIRSSVFAHFILLCLLGKMNAYSQSDIISSFSITNKVLNFAAMLLEIKTIYSIFCEKSLTHFM